MPQFPPKSVLSCLLNDLSRSALFEVFAVVTHISTVLPVGLGLLHHFHQLASYTFLYSGKLVLLTETQINLRRLLSTLILLAPSDSDLSN